MALALHHFLFSTWFAKIQYFKNVTVITCFDTWTAFYFSKMIHTHIVCNTQRPWQEFSLICITATSQCIYYTNEHILEQIFCQILIFYQQINRSVDLVFVTGNKGRKGFGVTIDVKVYQLLIGKVSQAFHNLTVFWF